jgi:hypothetical protein
MVQLCSAGSCAREAGSRTCLPKTAVHVSRLAPLTRRQSRAMVASTTTIEHLGAPNRARQSAGPTSLHHRGRAPGAPGRRGRRCARPAARAAHVHARGACAARSPDPGHAGRRAVDGRRCGRRIPAGRAGRAALAVGRPRRRLLPGRPGRPGGGPRATSRRSLGRRRAGSAPAARPPARHCVALVREAIPTRRPAAGEH